MNKDRWTRIGRKAIGLYRVAVLSTLTITAGGVVWFFTHFVTVSQYDRDRAAHAAWMSAQIQRIESDISTIKTSGDRVEVKVDKLNDRLERVLEQRRADAGAAMGKKAPLP